MRFKDKVAIVTGAGQGIGAHYARALAEEGAAVIVAEINAETGQKAVDSIAAAGGKALFVETDVSSEISTIAAAEAACKAFGGIDILVNNAAIFANMKRATWMDVDLDYYKKFMDVNMNGILLMTRAVHKSMENRGGGVILNQSSTAAWSAGGYYGLAKLGVNGLTIALAKELGARNIRVNGIAPGPTDTEATQNNVPPEVLKMLLAQMPLSRIGNTQDIINTALFLLSEDASWVTGQTWCVDGGQVLRP
ncbi:SDR family oxidoreductase [Hyphomonas johnsonii]|uniref:Short chain dehydrogenase n=1 Tax=Hyphomonas johnsonii MHS-2 TaxID=1280950 RepID=A0A059FR87_9PROT|nr:SDR family oxidoreductase [Hyphomonas johnsonii]KCZ93195.1 short chain dehydrogenase [Hyphomonas johnsonii MHS-2]